MPLNVRRVCSAGFLFLLVFLVFCSFSTAQTTDPQPAAAAPPTSGDVMRERISKAKAFIVVRNYNAAIYELENIRKESADPAILSGVNVLLMNCYLEQGDYKRAQDFLTQFFNEQKTTKPNAAANYSAVAAQIIKGARNRADRYRSLGLNITDRTLPLEALNDLEKMRETLELVIAQAKENGKQPARTTEAMALLEEATSSRSIIARDDYDARRWKDEVADTREAMANSRSVVLSAVGDSTAAPTESAPATDKPTATGTAASNNLPSATVPEAKPATREREIKAADTKRDENTAQNDPKPVTQPVVVPPVVVPALSNGDQTSDGPISVGSLVDYATRKLQPTYPPAARTVGASGVVRVEITINESGEVAEVQKTTGPSLLQAAAKDAVKKWKFKPFVRDGQPVKATGFVSFNFAL